MVSNIYYNISGIWFGDVTNKTAAGRLFTWDEAVQYAHGKRDMVFVRGPEPERPVSKVKENKNQYWWLSKRNDIFKRS